MGIHIFPAPKGSFLLYLVSFLLLWTLLATEILFFLCEVGWSDDPISVEMSF